MQLFVFSAVLLHFTSQNVFHEALDQRRALALPRLPAGRVGRILARVGVGLLFEPPLPRFGTSKQSKSSSSSAPPKRKLPRDQLSEQGATLGRPGGSAGLDLCYVVMAGGNGSFVKPWAASAASPLLRVAHISPGATVGLPPNKEMAVTVHEK
jgi:hypothetical protein